MLGLWFLSYEFLFTTAITYVIMYVCSIQVIRTIVPWYTWLAHLLTTYSCIMDQVYPCILALVWFSLLSLCPDGQHWICVGKCESMDSRELPRGGWISCTFVRHPEVLWVHYLPRVLDTWGHGHRLAPSLWSDGEDPCVPNKSSLGRVGV
jgi:hypothetical protein